jgi:hypothetical protein
MRKISDCCKCLIPQLFQTPLEESAFGLLFGVFQGAAIGIFGVGGSAEATEEFGACGMGEVIVGQIAAGEDGVDEIEAGLWAIAHGDGDGAIELDDRRGFDAREKIVEGDDLVPVCRARAGSVGVNGGDGGLDRVGIEAAGGEGALDEIFSFGNLMAIPERAILIFQEDQISFAGGSGEAAGIVQEHESEEAEHFGLWEQFHEEAGETDCFGGEIGAGERLAGGCGVAFVEDQVDDMEDGIESLGQVGRRGDLLGDAGVLDFGFGADDALGVRGRIGEDSAGDLFGGQAADFAEGEGDLRIGRDGRMAAGENQAQAIIFNIFGFRFCWIAGVGFELIGDGHQRGIEFGAAAHGVDALESAGGDQPGTGIGGDALARPLLDGGGKGVVKGFFGEIEIAEEADECRKNAAGFGAVDVFDNLSEGLADALETHKSHLTQTPHPNPLP